MSAITLGALVLNGCICPPEGCGKAASASAGQGAAAQDMSEPRFVFWDGEGAGASAKGWSACDKEPVCKASLELQPGSGKDGSTGLRLHGEGPGYIGGGWNFIGWWPEDGGYDVSSFERLTFSIKVVAPTEEEAPDPAALMVSLACSKGKKDSEAVSLKNYVPDILDGQWHDVAIPLGEFMNDDFDPGTVWQLGVNTWSQGPKKFDIYIDDIAVERDPNKSHDSGAESILVRTDGADLFAQHCASCHGEKGQGLTGGPAIIGKHALPEYPAEQTGASNPQLSNPGQVQTQRLTQVIGAGGRAPFRTAADVYDYISVRMPKPARTAGKLEPAEYWAILNYMLDEHGVELPEGGVNQANAASVKLRK